MRASEIVNLKLSDITTYEDDNYMYQIRVFGKGKKKRSVISINQNSRRIRRNNIFQKETGDKLGICLCIEEGRQITRYEYYTIVSKILKKAGINKKGFIFLDIR